MPKSRSSSRSPPIAPHLRPGYRPGDTSHITPPSNRPNRPNRPSGSQQQYYGRPGTPGSTIPIDGPGRGSGRSGGRSGGKGGGRGGGKSQQPGSTIPVRSQSGSQGLSVYRPDGSTMNPTSAEGQQMAAAVRAMKGRRYGKKSGQQSKQPVTFNPFGEFTKGMVEGVTDLAHNGREHRQTGGRKRNERDDGQRADKIDRHPDRRIQRRQPGRL